MAQKEAFINHFLEKVRTSLLAEHEALCSKRNVAHGRLAELKATKQAFINNKFAEYIRVRARYNAMMNFHSDT